MKPEGATATTTTVRRSEVLRVATTGHPNACSILYGACARAAKAVGAYRIITYTLDEETGASLRGSGWERQKDGIGSWWWHEGVRPGVIDRPHLKQQKVRWGLTFGERRSVRPPHTEPVPGPAKGLFADSDAVNDDVNPAQDAEFVREIAS